MEMIHTGSRSLAVGIVLPHMRLVSRNTTLLGLSLVGIIVTVLILGGAISGDGGLVKNNAANVSLGLDGIALHNTYTGLTTVAGGTLSLDKNNRIAIPGEV